MADYCLTRPNAPPASGWTLKCMVAVAESPAGSMVVNWSNRRSCPGLLQALREGNYNEEPRSLGIPPTWDSRPEESDATPARISSTHSSDELLSDSKDEQVVPSQEVHTRLEAALHSLGHSGTTLCSTASNARPTVLDYHYAYEQGMVTPSQVAERVIAFLDRLNDSFRFLLAYDAADIQAQAAAATERYAAGSSLSVFDGVPYVVKDCLDALPYETSCGTAFLGKLRPAVADSPCVAALRGLGAVLLGKAAMPELGAMGHSMMRTPAQQPTHRTPPRWPEAAAQAQRQRWRWACARSPSAPTAAALPASPQASAAWWA
ncbi:amidase signature domain-containing protein [Scenedesmus sp. NREL 46B-D3]|nr:amidase signature domain-containing protein [Scenedesmus sp. NREL 46B-D3]